MLATVGTIIAVLATVVGLIVQILTAGIYIGKLEGFKELINHRFNEQDKRLDAHNNFITRVYDLESKDKVKEEQIKVANNRIKDLEDIMK
jgi:hypothetical protein